MSAKKLEPPIRIGKTGIRWTSFPNRVWFQTPGGWGSRPVGKPDVKARRKLAERMGAVAFNLGEASDGAVTQKVAQLVAQLSVEEREKLIGWMRPIQELDERNDVPAIIDGNDNELGTVEE